MPGGMKMASPVLAWWRRRSCFDVPFSKAAFSDSLRDSRLYSQKEFRVRVRRKDIPHFALADISRVVDARVLIVRMNLD